MSKLLMRDDVAYPLFWTRCMYYAGKGLGLSGFI